MPACDPLQSTCNYCSLSGWCWFSIACFTLVIWKSLSVKHQKTSLLWLTRLDFSPRRYATSNSFLIRQLTSLDLFILTHLKHRGGCVCLFVSFSWSGAQWGCRLPRKRFHHRLLRWLWSVVCTAWGLFGSGNLTVYWMSTSIHYWYRSI